MIKLDGDTFDVPVLKLTRSADFLYKSAERSLDGKLHTELIGVYFNYKLSFGNILTAAQRLEYKRLWKCLVTVQDQHTVTVWDEDGEYEFEAYFAKVNDELKSIKDLALPKWQNLEVEFIARDPAAT